MIVVLPTVVDDWIFVVGVGVGCVLYLALIFIGAAVEQGIKWLISSLSR